MKYIILIFVLFSQLSFAKKPTVSLKYDLKFILEKVLERKNLDFKSEIPLPPLFLKSKTSLKQFQDAVESQWGQRPYEFTNVYSIKNNEIYLLDDADYYKKTGRCIDDSLAHELTHYVQVKYQNFDINDESLEWDAVDMQTWFREIYCKPSN